MLKLLTNYFKRRRRGRIISLKCKTIILLGIIIIFFIYKLFGSNPWEWEYDWLQNIKIKSIKSNIYQFLKDNHINIELINEEKEIYNKRKIILHENIDEFIIPLLKKYKYIEIDIKSIKNKKIDKYDDEIKHDLNKIIFGLGENGIKASVPESQIALAEIIHRKESFNRLLSDMISPNRSIDDGRESECKYTDYDEDNLPDTSVIIIYCNEAFSSLVRTIHSVINRSPSNLLKEIILVDDFSDKKDLQGKLERYIATKFPLNKVRLIRLLKRAGLTRARMIGAHLAIGDVLIFLDAHCETTHEWLQPLLQRIQEKRTAVLCPIIDNIDENSLEFVPGGDFYQVGGFTWSGHFYWINIALDELKRKLANHSPTWSPTMAGGLFAIERKYFWEIGSYDPEMEIWGGENLEMSFRIWQCGGTLEFIPCSRVGHIFRNSHPYTFPDKVDSHGLNTARLAEVWMDEYKEYFYKHRPALKTANYGDISKRIAMRKRLKCNNFEWYLNNIYKNKFKLEKDSIQYGQIKNIRTNHCLDNLQNLDMLPNYTLGVYPCHHTQEASQLFYLSKSYELRLELQCATTRGDKIRVEMIECQNIPKGEKWEYINNKIFKHIPSEKCLAVNMLSNGTGDLFMSNCIYTCPFQQWNIEHLNQSINEF